MSAAHERAMLGIAADLLEQGRILHGVSMLLTGAGVFIVAAASFVLTGGTDTAPRSWTVLLMFSVGLGAGQTVLALRTGLDAALFRRLAGGLDLSAFDSGMTALGLLPAHKAGRPALARVAGAKRLLVWQAAALAAQAVCFGGAAILPSSPGI